jgi:hypothetical protein
LILIEVLLAVALFAMWRGAKGNNPPLDREEIEIIRHFADQMRKEQFHPYE